MSGDSVRVDDVRPCLDRRAFEAWYVPRRTDYDVLSIDGEETLVFDGGELPACAFCLEDSAGACPPSVILPVPGYDSRDRSTSPSPSFECPRPGRTLAEIRERLPPECRELAIVGEPRRRETLTWEYPATAECDSCDPFAAALAPR